MLVHKKCSIFATYLTNLHRKGIYLLLRKQIIMVKNVVSRVANAPKRWLNNTEAEKYLGCKERFLRNLRQAGQLRFYKIGGHVLYEISDLDKLVLKNRVV